MGRRIGDLELLGRIGEGGMGVVERARDHRLHRDVAVKLLNAGLLADPAARERFDRECRIAATLQHPNIVPVYDVVTDKAQAYVVMMLVDGPDLAHVLATEGPLQPSRVAVIIGQIAAALDAAHARDLVHRDVKPGNILLANSGGIDHPYLTDFGLARAIGSSTALSRAGGAMGTLAYVAPEQLEGAPIDGRADTYSLACVTYEVLTGEPPFGRGSERALVTAHLTSAPPRVSAARASLPPVLDSVIARGMAKRASDRHESSGAFAKDLARALTGQTAAATAATAPLAAATVPLPPPSQVRDDIGMPTMPLGQVQPQPPPPQAQPKRRAPLVAAAVVLLLVGVLGITGFMLLGGSTESTASVSPATSATPSDEPTPTPSPFPEDEVEELKKAVPARFRATCVENLTSIGDTLVHDYTASVTCRPYAGGIARVGYWSFPTRAALAGWWDERRQLSGLTRSDDRCWDGEIGEGEHGSGRLMCTRQGSNKVRWYDEDTQTYGVVTGAKGVKFEEMVSWWRTSGLLEEGTPVYTTDEQWLLNRIKPGFKGTCYPWHELTNTNTGAYLPSVVCDPDGKHELALFLFKNRKSMIEHYDERTGPDSAKVPEAEGCWNDRRGHTDWDEGELACFYSSAALGRYPQLRWVDRSSNVYGVLDGEPGMRIGELYRWWEVNVLPHLS